ncbi:hypothetical protein GQ472_00715 [archaeon]|nr:hypothetical protein [archaeon]
MNRDIVEAIFPETIKKIEDKICPICDAKIGRFRDELSKREYAISGLCQRCQDDICGG